MKSANENTRINTAVTDKGLFCPTCGAAAVDASSLAGGDASCRVCDWKGKVEDLAVVHFRHDFTSKEEFERLYFLDIRALLAPHAEAFARFFVRWGFVTIPINPKLLARYLAATARAIATSIIEEREKIEKEKLNG